MSLGPHIKTVVDRTAEVAAAIAALRDRTLLIGIPASSAARGSDEPLNNATIGYIQEFGAPEARIPARPFLRPTVVREQPRITEMLKMAGQYALDGKQDAMERTLEALGMYMQNAVRLRISEGIPPPLSPRTIAERERKHKSAKPIKGPYGKGWAKNALSPAFQGWTPLVDTGKLRAAITYVVRSRLSGKDYSSGKRGR